MTTFGLPAPTRLPACGLTDDIDILWPFDRNIFMRRAM